MWFFLLLGLQLFSVSQLTASYSPPRIAKPNCADRCGNITIPFPFGIGANCYYNESYKITCDTSFQPPKAFLPRFNLEVLDIFWKATDPGFSDDGVSNQQVLRGRTNVQGKCRSKNSTDLGGTPYRFSGGYNVVLMQGCDGSVVLKDRNGDVVTGCATMCVNHTLSNNIAMKHCYGFGCCQAPFYDSLHFFQLEVDHEEAHSSTCDMKVGLIDSSLVDEFGRNTVPPTILEWAVPASYVHERYLDNITCYDFTCSCSFFYEGNPYLPDGCQVVRKCRKCKHRCSVAGQNHFYCDKYPLFKWGSILGFSLGMGLVILLLGCYWLYRVAKRKKEVKRRSDYFKRNGGMLLQQQIGMGEGSTYKTKVFSVTELEKATDNFNKNRILGHGGQGTVYKGMLKDGRIVAIKKSKKVDEDQLEPFVNEVVILSQINHRNVVKLLGCCLETEVPLLVYEFIQNGTLHQHIHHASEDFHVTWKMRLQMAAESADAIAYLHSFSSTPIYHRDIKSANILLDAKFRAKVSDFGTSKVIEIEQTHLTTCVVGTYGYLDPEYFQSNQFTEKSDVYSFGVVLVELITGKKPICPTKDGGWISLAVEFLFHMENSCLSDILDAQVLDEGNKEEIVAVANMARRCLNMNGKQRPTMREVAMVLDEIRSSHVPHSTEPSSKVGKGVMMETSDKQSGSSSTNMFFSDIGHGASSTEVQRIMAHTL